MASLPRIAQLAIIAVILVGAIFLALLFYFPPVEVILGQPVPVRWGKNDSSSDPLIRSLTVGRYISLIAQSDKHQLLFLTPDGMRVIQVGAGQYIDAAKIPRLVSGKVQLDLSTLTYKTYLVDELTKLLHFFQPIAIESDLESGTKILFPQIE